MTPVCDTEALEALVADALSPERAFALQTHVRGCPACARELAWLRTERRLMAERKSAEPGLPPELWRAVENRIGAAQPAPRPRRGGRFLARLAFPVLTGAAALAAGLLLYFRVPPGSTLRPLPGQAPAVSASRPDIRPAAGPSASASSQGVMAVLDAALVEYQQAVAELEADLRRSRGRLPVAVAQDLDRRFGPARRELDQARVGASGTTPGDPEARLRALDGYADYVRSLQAAVLAVEGTPR
jgi:hypothetical protein